MSQNKRQQNGTSRCFRSHSVYTVCKQLAFLTHYRAYHSSELLHARGVKVAVAFEDLCPQNCSLPLSIWVMARNKIGIQQTCDLVLSKSRKRSAKRRRRKERARVKVEQKQQHSQTETRGKQNDPHAQWRHWELSLTQGTEKATNKSCELEKLTKEEDNDAHLIRHDLGSNEQTRTISWSLSREQFRVLGLVLSGVNVFYTGGAGTGKSTVLQALVEELRLGGRRVQVVAPTGISALNVGGSTYYTWAGWTPGIAKMPIDEARTLAMSKQRRLRMRETNVVIIDEISMIEANQIRRLNRACRAARGCDAAFGGQIVVTGDFYQLPPVKAFQTCFKCGTELQRRAFCIDCEPHANMKISLSARSSARKGCQECGAHPLRWSDCPNCGILYDMDDQWAFRSDTWDLCGFHCVSLAKVYRQNDPEFVQILNTLRVGERLQKNQLALLDRQRSDIGAAIELSALRSTADQKNFKGLRALSGAIRAYCCEDYVHIETHHPHLGFMADIDGDGNRVGCREHRFAPLLETKCGMPVVLLANIDIGAGLVNGSQGRIIGYLSNRPFMQEREHRLAQSDDINLLQEGQITCWIRRQPATFPLPIVQFDNGVQQVIHPICQYTELGDPRPFSTVARTQIPLLPAWAITIHKSQGMTLERVVVNLDPVFEMAYVALSRARSLTGLQVLCRTSLDSLQERGRLGGCSLVVKDFMEKQFGRPTAQSKVN